MKFLRQSFILLIVVIILSFGSIPELNALTRKVIRTDNHVFTYSVQPSWKSGPIQDPTFDLWFKIFNDDPRPFTLEKIVVDYPNNLRIKQRGYDKKPIIRPRKKMNLDTSQNRVTFSYNETLRGFVEGKLAKKRMVNIKYFVPGDFTVTDPIKFQVIWSPVDESDTDVITLKKDLAINS